MRTARWLGVTWDVAFSLILDSEAEVWFRVHWLLSEELFLFWYIWFKDNSAMVEGFVEEVKTAIGVNQTRSLSPSPSSNLLRRSSSVSP